MRMHRIQPLLALALVALTIEGGCVIVPEVNEKDVDFVVSGSVCDTLDAVGVMNNHDDEGFIDLLAGLDLQQIVSDAGLDVMSVSEVLVWGVTYKTTQPDPEATREIVNGTLTVQRGSGTGPGFVASDIERTIVSNFNVMVNSVTTDQTAPVDTAGIRVLNNLLEDLLANAKSGQPVANPVIRYHLTGASTPQNIATDFKWRICVSVNAKVRERVDVVE